MAPTPALIEEEEDDYLNMTFDDPTVKTQKETLTQKKKRLVREAEERARPKSKAQLAEDERAKRDAALFTANVDKTNKGFKMMAALGYTPGTALGKDNYESRNGADKRLLEPIGLDMKEDRSGIGADSEKKRKFREQVEQQQESEKRQKTESLEFRERQQREREQKRHEGQYYGAMKVAERLEDEDQHKSESSLTQTTRPLSSYNVLWRGLVKQRLQHEREKRIRFDMDQSLSRLPTYNDSDEDRSDQLALSRKAQLQEVDLELDQDDPELDAFEALPVTERLERLVTHLRQQWRYCFWCKFRYVGKEMEGCPGTTEEDHD